MRKRKATTNVISFSQRQQRPLSIPSPLESESLYDVIPRKRTLLLAEAINHKFADDSVGLEAVLALICAIADPDGDPEKFQSAQTALFELTVNNMGYHRIERYVREVLL